MSHILIVEDEPIIRSALKRLLERNSYTVSEATSVKEAEHKYHFSDFDLIISDLRLPGAPGTDLIPLAETIPVLIMTSYASLKSAVDSMRRGAVDYIAKPFDHDEMLNAVARILKAHKERQLETVKKESSSQPSQPKVKIKGMIGSCPAMKTLFRQISRIAPADVTVLVNGETGTGKELVARSLHEKSNRHAKPLISVNCAAIPETLIEAELFGHEKGAFTGAAANREGLIVAAEGGTLFLDEIGELPLEAQARLLRVLQESEIRPLGSSHTRKVDVRIVAATHRDLKQLAADGLFREDLYYRINVVQITLPPLRKRGKDVLEIAEKLLIRSCDKHGRTSPIKFSDEAVRAMSSYSWPGNIREMENAIERATILCDSDEITVDLLGIDNAPASNEPVTGSDPYSAVLKDTSVTPRSSVTEPTTDPAEGLSLEDYFQRFVLEHQDQMSETELAQKLGVSRKCLWERRQRFGIPRKKTTSNGK